MAGEPLSLEELKTWYTTFNTVITNYGGGTISTLPVPANQAKVLPTDVNNMYDKIQAMKNDEFLGTQNFYSTFTKVAQGEIVERADATPIIETAQKIASIKCRNTTTFTNGYHSHTTKSHTNKSHTSQSNGTQSANPKSNGNNGNQNNAHGTYSGCSTNWCNNGLCYWTQQSNGTYGQGTNTHGTHSHTANSHGANSHTAKSNETQKDILNIHTTYNKN